MFLHLFVSAQARPGHVVLCRGSHPRLHRPAEGEEPACLPTRAPHLLSWGVRGARHGLSEPPSVSVRYLHLKTQDRAPAPGQAPLRESRREHAEVPAIGRAPAETRWHADNFRSCSEDETRAGWAARSNWCRQGHQGRALRRAEGGSHAGIWQRGVQAEGRPCRGPGAGTWYACVHSRAACV